MCPASKADEFLTASRLGCLKLEATSQANKLKGQRRVILGQGDNEFDANLIRFQLKLTARSGLAAVLDSIEPGGHLPTRTLDIFL